MHIMYTYLVYVQVLRKYIAVKSIKNEITKLPAITQCISTNNMHARAYICTYIYTYEHVLTCIPTMQST